MESTSGNLISVRSREVGDIVVVYASDYLNRLSGERIERECRRRLESGARALVMSFRDTQLVNSIGVSILLGIIDAANRVGVTLVFSDLNESTVQLFEMLGLSRHARFFADETAAIEFFQASSVLTVQTQT